MKNLFTAIFLTLATFASVAHAGESAPKVTQFCVQAAGDAVELMQMATQGYSPEQFIADVKKYYESRPDIQRYLVKLGTLVYGEYQDGHFDPVEVGLKALNACVSDEWPEVHPGEQL